MRKRNRFLLWCSWFFTSLGFLVAQIDAPISSLHIGELRGVEKSLTAAGIYTATYYNLGCKHQGWEGYFSPQRWYQTVDFGDGGVDVTEAPNAKVAEGVASDWLEIQTGSSLRYAWRITVPADGYLFFRLEKVGSFLSPRISSTDTGLQIIHNDKFLAFQTLSDGSYYSPFLKAGETFGVLFEDRSALYAWSDFTFYSNSVGVLVTPASETGNRWVADKVVPIPKASIDQLFFPGDEPETWPMLDIDGDLYTLDDQVIAKPGDTANPLLLSYRDQVQLRDGQYWLSREFTVKEPCGGNSLKVNRWWYPLPLLPFPMELEGLKR